jgi:uncharacterized protein with von Willebrand factor type A (vWA) domain
VKEPLNIVGAVRGLLREAKVEVTPELDRMLVELDSYQTLEDRQKLEDALRAALPELRDLKRQVGDLLEQPEPEGKAPALSPDRAKGLLAELSEAWSRRDGKRVDAILRALEAELPGSAEAERRRIESEVRSSIAASFSGFSLKPLSEAGGED